ncbi:cadherin-like and PC-esterase domain-containing protein 1 [Littorina saxatilis]|uniref:cadherin-like and PC-esterase domain-containing protein 1 n=1 Tax=Littorina saxatilis TaxID=31220 RepID=UPI0038B663F1
MAGSNPQLGQDALLVESALRKHSAKVTHITLQDDEEVSRTLQESIRGQWSVLLCLNTSSQADACVVSATTSLPALPHQKMNVIPGLKDVLRQPDLLCRHRGQLEQGRWLNTNLRCANLSDVAKNDELDADRDVESICERHPLLLSPSHSSAEMNMSICSETEESPDGAVALQLPANRPLTWEDTDRVTIAKDDDHPHSEASLAEDDRIGRRLKGAASDWRRALTWRFPVLVTSLSPLRVYMHSEGVVWDGLTSYLQQKPQRGLSLLELQQMAADRHGDGVAAATVGQLEESVMNILVHWEHLADVQSLRSCQRCFQLLEMTVVFNTTFHPFVLQVGASSLSGRLSSLSEYLVRQTSLNDLAAILTEHRNVSVDLAKAFVDMGLSSVVQGNICNADKKFCLGPRELVYLLDGLREHLAKTGWKRIYPSASAVRFTRLLQSKTAYTTTTTTTTNTNRDTSPPMPTQPPLRTSELHSLLLGLESFFLRVSDGGQSESFEDLSVPIDQSNQRTNGSDGESFGSNLLKNDAVTGPPCSEEPGSLPYLSSLVTRPSLILQPKFSPLQTEYKVEVEHTVQLVTVWAWSQSCQSQARLEDKHNTDSSANFTLGVGVNTLRIFVVDTTHDEPWVVNTYTLTVTRLDADHGLGAFRPGVPHVVCSLKQDCSLPYSPREPCGLQPVTSVTSWSQFLTRRTRLPACTSGDEAGVWHVPCSSCGDHDAQCYWKEAVWSPFTCREPRLSQAHLQRCFKNKKVLFIGDSTNRGILHYMSQRVNGSLWEWPDKTHHLRVYPPINHNTTRFSFAYYPQFWLPALHRPVFDKALYQVIRRTLPLDNSSNTVVVVGGVHWLATHHLKVVRTALTREGLTGAQVIVKGLGSGFHQPVSGVHRLSQKEQEKLLWHNQHVMSYAKQQGMDVVDTFNITMARYSNFLQGRCTCHFHRITPEKHRRKGEHSPLITTYNVEGEVNAAYAEMVINRICRPT